MPFCHTALEAPKPPPPGYPRELRTLGAHLRKRRLDLGLLQREVAEQIGVDGTSICNWENNRTSPSFHFVSRIVEFLGYVPDVFPTDTLGERIVAARRLLGLTQKKLAHRLGVDPSTLGRWERGKGQPSKRLLERITAFPNSLPCEYSDTDMATRPRA